MNHESTKILQTNNLLKSLDNLNIEDLPVKGNLLSFNEGEFVFDEGDFADSVYLVARGEVKLLKKGEEAVQENLTDESFFGYYELNENSERKSSAVAVQDSYLVEFTLEDIKQLCELETDLKDVLASSPLMNGVEFNNSVFDENPFTDESTKGFTSEADELVIPDSAEQSDAEEEVFSMPEEDGDDLDLDALAFDVEEDDEPDIEETLEPFEEDMAEDAEETIDAVESDSGPEEVVTEIKEVIKTEYVSKPAYSADMSDAIEQVVTQQSLFGLNNTYLYKCIELCDSEGGVIYEYSEKKKCFVPFIATDDIADYQPIYIGEGVAGWAVEKQETTKINDVSMDEKFHEEYDEFDSLKSSSMIIHPVVIDEKVKFVIKLFNQAQGEYTDIHSDYLNVLTAVYKAGRKRLTDYNEDLKGQRQFFLKKIAQFLVKDIKQPILVTKRYAEHLREKYIPEDIEKVLKIMSEHLEETTDTIKSISDYAAGDIVLRKNTIYLNRFLKDMKKNLDPVFGETNCEIELNLQKSCRIYVDNHKLYLVIKNLLNNSVEAMKNGGKIVISTNPLEQVVEILIKDEGEGINPEMKEHLFEPFTTTDDSASGLGLYLSKVIIEKHEGTLELVSTGVSGTELKVTLPVDNEL